LVKRYPLVNNNDRGVFVMDRKTSKEAQRPRLVHLSDSLVRKIDAAAQKAGDTSRSAFIRRALTERLAQDRRQS
jgi:hypothetical protein